MSNNEYRKSVTSTNSINLSNINFSTNNIANYNKKVNNSPLGSGRASVSVTLNLDALLTDNLDETVTNEKIANSKAYETEKEGFFENVLDAWISTQATMTVVGTSILSGILDVGESIVDGGAWVASKAVSIFNPEAGDAIEEFIARDLVTEANEWFYEETELGNAINSASYMKYDSETAQTIRSVSEEATEIVAATLLTVSPLGATGALVVGAYSGLGNAAEDTYANGTDTTLFQEGMIMLNGGLSALGWYSQGQLGKGLIQVGESIHLMGLDKTVQKLVTEIFSKDMLKELTKPGKLFCNMIKTLSQVSGDIGLIANKLLNGEEVTPEEVALLITEMIVFFGLNALEEAVRTEIEDFALTDDDALRVARSILDPNNSSSLSNALMYNDDSLKKIITLMSSSEITEEISKLSPSEVQRVLKLLSTVDYGDYTEIIKTLCDYGDDVEAAMEGVELLGELDAEEISEILSGLAKDMSGEQLAHFAGGLGESSQKYLEGLLDESKAEEYKSAMKELYTTVAENINEEAIEVLDERAEENIGTEILDDIGTNLSDAADEIADMIKEPRVIITTDDLL